MSRIEQILTRSNLHREDEDSLKDIRMNSEAAYEGIISGMGAIGNIVFWACDNENYSDDMARRDLRDLGEMLMYLPGIAAAMNFNALEADANLREKK